MSKKHKFLLIGYAILVIGALIFIVFLAPEKWFIKEEKVDIPISDNEEQEIKEVDYEEQKSNLNKYNYDYTLMYSMQDKTYYFECEGKRNENEEIGKCTLPSFVEYNINTKKDVFKEIDSNLLDPTYIFDLIKDSEEEVFDNESYIEYRYEITFEELSTEISIRSNKKIITDITISNAYIQYHLKFSDIKV